MKKNEWIILAVIVLFTAGVLFWTNMNKNKPSDAEITPEPAEQTLSPEDRQYMVSIVYHNTVIQTFDCRVDAVYHVDGDYGGLEVEVKDNKWHVINEQCPNHICAEMGWAGIDDIMPITCLPNGVFIYPGVEE